MAEALARAEDVDDLALVDELDRALEDDEQMVRGRPVLEQDALAAARSAAPRRRAAIAAELGRLEAVERGEAAEEVGDGGCVHALHYSARRFLSSRLLVTKSRVLPACAPD